MALDSFSAEFRVQFVFVLEQVLNGLLVGAYYLLIALGLSLIFALGGIVNLAHGGFYAIGAYLAVILANHIGFVGALGHFPGDCRMLRHRHRTALVSPLLPFGPDLKPIADVRAWRWSSSRDCGLYSAPPRFRFRSRLNFAASCWSATSSIRATDCSFSAVALAALPLPGSSSIGRHSAAWCGRACKTRTSSVRSAFHLRLT